MIGKDAHPSVLKGVVNGVCNTVPSKFAVDAGMNQEIDGRRHPHCRKPLAADTSGFALVDQRDCGMVGSIGDGRGFTVVERNQRRTDYETLEMLQRDSAKTDDSDHPAVDEFTELIGLTMTVSPANLEFRRNDIRNDDQIRESFGNRRRASCRNQVNDRARIRDDFRFWIN
jgi:hypothetical protein